jgi:ureidoacrylate peracid hydrolase
MHTTELPPDVVARVIQRRGHLHPFDSIHPAKTALVVVDMQNAFCKPGMALAVPNAREIAPNINVLADAMRRAGGRVIWIQMSIPDEASWPVFLGNLIPSKGAKADVLDSLQPASEGHSLWPEMVVDSENDWIISKNRFSAFLPGACDLTDRLRAEKIDTVVIVGTLTNVCCESSARDAAMQDFKVVMVSDGNACHTDEAHTATLSTIIQSFGDVRTTRELVDLISAASVPA